MNNIESKVQIHFEGDIAGNHEIPVRTLGKCFLHIQNAFDRAYLDLKYKKGVFKYARMSTEDYIENELFVDVPEDGGYIANLFSRNKKAKKLLIASHELLRRYKLLLKLNEFLSSNRCFKENFKLQTSLLSP